MADQPGTTLTGYIDEQMSTDAYGHLIDLLLEQDPQLVWPASIRLFARMRHEPQLAAILQVYGAPIGRARWEIADDKGVPDEVKAAIADDLGLPVAGTDQEPTGARRRGFNWTEHLRMVAMKRVYGHAFFEQAWEFADGRWRLATIQERMPQTIAKISLNSDGTLKSIEQETGIGQKTGPVITTADHRLVAYVRDREGSNYFGQSLLRPAYGPWLIKSEMVRVHATSIRRWGMGVPTAEALPGTSPLPQQMVEAQRVVANLKASENMGVAMPPGFRLNLAGMSGSVPDALGFITYMDRLMTRYTLTSLIDMAVAERGNRSLGETMMDLMILAQQADANAIADDATRQIVIPLVDANWGPDTAAPRIVCGDVGADVELTAQDINWLMAVGGLHADEPFRGHIRQRYGLPPEDPTDPANTPAAPAAPAAPADTTPPGGAQDA